MSRKPDIFGGKSIDHHGEKFDRFVVRGVVPLYLRPMSVEGLEEVVYPDIPFQWDGQWYKAVPIQYTPYKRDKNWQTITYEIQREQPK